ncbi:MAG: hypothetical protein K2V38_03690, partial [Gemmataceae bacterium]|nr:hypothetical protein [Gemmataceae bacterium]
ALERWVLPADSHPVVVLAAGGVTGALAYIAILRAVSPGAASDARTQLASVWGRLAGRFSRRGRTIR